MDNKLPKLLVVMLDKLLEEGPISTWNIRGGPHFTQVTIRFPSEDMADRGEIQYRRTPPSQLQRDRTRAINHKNQAMVERRNMGMDESNGLEVQQHTGHPHNDNIPGMEENGLAVITHEHADDRDTSDSAPALDQFTVADEMQVNTNIANTSTAEVSAGSQAEQRDQGADMITNTDKREYG